VKSLDSVIENIQATQSIQCKQTQKLIEVQDSDGDLLSGSDMGVAISNPTMDWAAEDPQPFITNHNRAFMKKTREMRKRIRGSNESAPGSVKRSSVTRYSQAVGYDHMEGTGSNPINAKPLNASQKPTKMLMVGRGGCSSGALKAAPPPAIKKRFFYLGNVDPVCTEETIQSVLRESSIDAISVYKIKPREEPKLSDPPPRVCGFRICIDSKNEEAFLWPDGVVVRNWIFNPKSSSPRVIAPRGASNTNSIQASSSIAIVPIESASNDDTLLINNE